VHPHRPKPRADDRQGGRLAPGDGGVSGDTRQDVEAVGKGVEQRRRLEPRRRRAVLDSEEEKTGEPRPRRRGRNAEQRDREQAAGDDGGDDEFVTLPAGLPVRFLRVLGVDVGVEDIVDAVQQDVRGEQEVGEQLEADGQEKFGDGPCGSGDADDDGTGEVEPESGARQRQQVAQFADSALSPAAVPSVAIAITP
jgi:hypothetical protein